MLTDMYNKLLKIEVTLSEYKTNTPPPNLNVFGSEGMNIQMTIG